MNFINANNNPVLHLITLLIENCNKDAIAVIHLPVIM